MLLCKPQSLKYFRFFKKAQQQINSKKLYALVTLMYLQHRKGIEADAKNVGRKTLCKKLVKSIEQKGVATSKH